MLIGRPRSLSNPSVCTKAPWVLPSGRQSMPDAALQSLVHRTSANVFLFIFGCLELHVFGFYDKSHLKFPCPRAIKHSRSFFMVSSFTAHGPGLHCHMISDLMGGTVVFEPVSKGPCVRIARAHFIHSVFMHPNVPKHMS